MSKCLQNKIIERVARRAGLLRGLLDGVLFGEALCHQRLYARDGVLRCEGLRRSFCCTFDDEDKFALRRRLAIARGGLAERRADDLFVQLRQLAAERDAPLRAESPGPTVSKMVPRMVDSSKILYGIYFGLTVIQMIFYLAGGMPLFDTLCNAFATAGTGGFAIKADSFAGYSYYHQTVTTVFMALFGVNFSIYFFLLRRKFDLVWKNTELRWYLGLIFGAIAVITVNTLSYYPRVYDAFHHAAFAVSSIITTTGYGTVDFNLWPELSRVILVFLMIIGACAGSTGGGLKVSRLIILFRAARAEIHRLLHPHTVKVMQMDGKPISRESIRSVSTYLILYVFLVMASVLLVSLDNFDGSTTLTAVLATFNNIGPGLGLVGPTGSFAAFSPLSKIVLCLDMLFGRLELYPMLVLFCPSTWKRK